MKGQICFDWSRIPLFSNDDSCDILFYFYYLSGSYLIDVNFFIYSYTSPIRWSFFKFISILLNPESGCFFRLALKLMRLVFPLILEFRTFIPDASTFIGPKTDETDLYQFIIRGVFWTYLSCIFYFLSNMLSNLTADLDILNWLPFVAFMELWGLSVIMNIISRGLLQSTRLRFGVCLPSMLCINYGELYQPLSKRLNFLELVGSTVSSLCSIVSGYENLF